MCMNIYKRDTYIYIYTKHVCVESLSLYIYTSAEHIYIWGKYMYIYGEYICIYICAEYKHMYMYIKHISLSLYIYTYLRIARYVHAYTPQKSLAPQGMILAWSALKFLAPHEPTNRQSIGNQHHIICIPICISINMNSYTLSFICIGTPEPCSRLNRLATYFLFSSETTCLFV